MPQLSASSQQRTNDAALKLIKQSEGFVDHWYPDPARGWDVPTCGYGHTDAAGEPHYKDTKTHRFTPGEASDILARDLEAVEREVAKLVKVDLTDNQFGALVSFTFNLGGENLATSTLLKRVNAERFKDAANEFSKWVYANHKKLDGLVTRRAAERALFLTPDGQSTPATPETPPAGFLAALVAILNAILSIFARKE